VTGTARGQSLEETLAFIESALVKDPFLCYFSESQSLYEEKLRFAREFVADLRANLY
jgi:hypothetical protein